MEEQNVNIKTQKDSSLSISASILIVGVLIAGSIFFTGKGATPQTNLNTDNQSDVTLNPVLENEHILGNPNALIVLVEFSDTECPFCQRFHTTMKSVMDLYGKDGKLAWVYRHFPLDSLHSKTRKEAEATECVNELGGNTAFWKMLDTIYANTPTNNGLELSQLPIFAEQAGVDVTKFNTCLASGKYAVTVEAQFQDGVKAGAQGTPYNILVLKNELSDDQRIAIQSYVIKNNLAQNVSISSDNMKVVLNGALSVDMVKAILDIVLK